MRLYATKNLPQSSNAIVLVDLPPREDGVKLGWIFRRVELAGKIIELDYGYRAQRARIAELNGAGSRCAQWPINFWSERVR